MTAYTNSKESSMSATSLTANGSPQSHCCHSHPPLPLPNITADASVDPPITQVY